MQLKRGEAGFTIIELLVVLALISILATMGMAQYRNGQIHAREAVLKTDLFDLRDAIDQYYADKGMWVASRRSGRCSSGFPPSSRKRRSTL